MKPVMETKPATSEVREVFFCRCPYSYKSVYRFQWKYSDARMTVYSEPFFRTKSLALGDLIRFQGMVIKELAGEVLP